MYEQVCRDLEDYFNHNIKRFRGMKVVLDVSCADNYLVGELQVDGKRIGYIQGEGEEKEIGATCGCDSGGRGDDIVDEASAVAALKETELGAMNNLRFGGLLFSGLCFFQ